MAAPGNLADLVARNAAATPDKAALHFGAVTLHWAEFEDLVARLADRLRGLGLERGDRVGLVLGNTPDFPVAYLAVLRAGLVAVPVNPGYTEDELAHVLGDAGATVVVAAPEAAERVRAAVDGTPTPVTVLTGTGQPADLVDALPETSSPPGGTTGGGEDLAALIYTSGTSGRPRGAMLTHRALLANLEQTARIRPEVVQATDVVLLVLPLFHVYGLNGGLGVVLWHGATGVLEERFDPVETLAALRRFEVSSVVGAPQMYVAWSMLPDLGDAFTSVRVALSGAAPLPPGAQARLLDVTGHHVFEGYGLTETAPVLTSTLMSEVPKPNSIGRPIPGVELRLLDESGAEVDEDDPGEIVVRGANLFSGYWPDGADGPCADGWWATGDVAVADSETDLHLVGRRRELILVSGFNVYPVEVEAVLTALPGVAEAAVIGIPHPYTGETVKALVVAAPGASLRADDLVAAAGRSLARFKCPTAVEFVDALPHTATGKVAKGRLREAEQQRADGRREGGAAD